MPDKYKYYFKTSKEVEQTLNLINQIPQEKRKGKYIVPCIWLRKKHQVNLKINFDNKILEIVNTGNNVDLDVINKLQQELRSNFKEDSWVVYENHIIQQSTANCVIASNIVATEEVILEERVDGYNKKVEELIKTIEKIDELWFFKHINKLFDNFEEQEETIDNEIEQLNQQKETLQLEKDDLLNKIISSKDERTKVTFNKEIKYFLFIYGKKIKQIVLNEIQYQDLKNEIEKIIKEKQEQKNEKDLLNILLQQKKNKINNIKQDKERLKIEKENFVRCNLILKERLFNEYSNQFNREWSEKIMNKGVAIRVVK